MPGKVQAVELPAEIRELSALPRVDYADAFLLKIGRHAGGRGAEEWARTVLEGAPAHVRRALRRAWLALGFKLASAEDERAVLGWPVRLSTQEVVMLGADSRIGMPAELFVAPRPEGVVAGTLLAKSSPVARLVWAAVERPHQRVVPAVLARARVG
jgi:hypothetical protein